MEHKPLLISCSHRAQANSHRAALLFQQGVVKAGGQADLVHLRSLKLLPCTACRVCEKDPESRCILSAKDDTRDLFDLLYAAPFVFFASPIYFYHLPSIFKTLIDRGQEVWAAREKGDARVRALPERPAYVCLVAGRSRGKKLFDGALLTLKYFLKSFNLVLAEPLTFRGVDRIDDLARKRSACAAIADLGAEAWRAHLARGGQDPDAHG
jgi:multimeric flavodoxin WrbA